MSTTTTNYGLIKPDTTDPILIGQLNDNSDAIDAALKENADAIENKPDAADIPTPSTAAPAMDGTAAAGTSTDYARADHVHPSDTSKQDALTTAQLAAVDSGIDSAKVEQIETNKNNILYNCINGGANLCPINSGTTTGAAFVFDWTNTGIIPAGVYEFSFETSTTTGAVACETQGSDGTRTGYRIITLPAKTGDITISDGTAKIRVFANAAMSLSKIRLVPSTFKDIPYQPYTMSNAELTAAIQALQAQLANQ